MKILEKFDTVTVDSFSALPAEDRYFVDRTVLQYNECVDNLSSWREALTETSGRIGDNPFLKLTKKQRNFHNGGDHYFSIERDYETDHSEINWTRRSLFSPAFSLLYIEEKLAKLPTERNEIILAYFNTKYTLSISLSDTKIGNVALDDLIDLIISENGGRGFEDAGKENIIKYFAHSSFKKGEINSNKISFAHVYFTEYGRYFSNSSPNRTALIKALSLFETGSITSMTSVGDFLSDLTAGRLYEPSSTDIKRFKGIRLYKNYKCELFFDTHGSASEFYEMFRIAKQ